MGARFSNAILQTLLVLFKRRPPKVGPSFFSCTELLQCIHQGRRLLIIATSSLRPILTDLGLSETFDAELRVPPVSSLRALEHVVEELELFPSDQHRRRAIRMLEEAGFGSRDELDPKLQIGIKKLLSTIEMARQEPENVAERLTGALMELRA